MHGSSSLIAQLVLLLWVPVCAVLFASTRPALATAWAFIGSTMFLPERVGFDPPLLPPMDKYSITAIVAFLAAMTTRGRMVMRARPGTGVDLFLLLLLVGAFGTAMTNKDVLAFGPTVLPALKTYDAISMFAGDLLEAYIPFLLGRAMFRSGKDLRDLLSVLAMGGLLYSMFILIELRFSPQLHRWVYGFHQHHFAQTLRGGGYRPMVFMGHGLAVAMFTYASLISAAALSRARFPVFSIPSTTATFILTGVLAACKSLGAFLYGLCSLPLVLAARSRFVGQLCTLLALFVIAFPTLRASDLFPTIELVELADKASTDRAQSLNYRFTNEDRLLARAMERKWFGWGSFGRNRVYDPESGRDISVTDGYWIIQLGSRGILGSIGAFGLLLFPIFGATRRLRKIVERRDQHMVGALILIATITAVDLLPNGLFSNLPFFIAGALAGVSQGLSAAKRRA